MVALARGHHDGHGFTHVFCLFVGDNGHSRYPFSKSVTITFHPE
jgi:hypothetical protein